MTRLPRCNCMIGIVKPPSWVLFSTLLCQWKSIVANKYYTLKQEDISIHLFHSIFAEYGKSVNGIQTPSHTCRTHECTTVSLYKSSRTFQHFLRPHLIDLSSALHCDFHHAGCEFRFATEI
ncbi:hypothetical protein VNO77_27769 [Canavalia gladiata]|uniref:Uncharacterized protein n=1 Tax=Canavalia gladiata TaxID=3824 RepID=A0AAN9KUL5_CANGL